MESVWSFRARTRLYNVSIDMLIRHTHGLIRLMLCSLLSLFVLALTMRVLAALGHVWSDSSLQDSDKQTVCFSPRQRLILYICGGFPGYGPQTDYILLLFVNAVSFP